MNPSPITPPEDAPPEGGALSQPLCAPHQPWLAPLAGYSNLPFRLLCRGYGCAVAVTEMVSAKGLLLGSPGTADLLRTCPEDSPLVVQLFGAHPEEMAEATAHLVRQGFLWFDINAGCAVPKVVKNGSGAALLRDPGRLIAIVEAMVAVAGRGRVGVKMRLGWHDASQLPSLAQHVEAAGAGWITLHPRTATQGFSGQARWEYIARLRHSVSTVVLASGDLFSAEDGVRCVESTGAHGVMFARGAMGDPGIFLRFRALLEGRPVPPKDVNFVAEAIARLAQLHHYQGTARQGLLQLRTLAPRFFRGLPGARSIRSHIISCHSWEDALHIIHHEVQPWRSSSPAPQASVWAWPEPCANSTMPCKPIPTAPS